MHTGFINRVKLNGPFIELSEKLRQQLELKIEELFSDNAFINSFAKTAISPYYFGEKSFLSQHIIGSNNNTDPNRIVIAIKTWMNMYYDDRLSVLGKFRENYDSRFCAFDGSKNKNAHCIFCRMLVNEFLNLMTDPQWLPLIGLTSLN